MKIYFKFIMIITLVVIIGSSFTVLPVYARPGKVENPETVSWLNIGSTYGNNNGNNRYIDISTGAIDFSINGVKFRWKIGEVIPIDPGTNEIRIEIGQNKFSQSVNISPGSYYVITFYCDVNSFTVPIPRNIRFTLADATKVTLHGYGVAYEVFSKAENKAGINKLSNGIGKMRAPTKPSSFNFGLYDINSSPSDLVTVRIKASKGTLACYQFNNDEVFWYGDKDGGVIRIPSGKHSLKLIYAATLHRGGGGGLIGLASYGIAALANINRDEKYTPDILLNYEFFPGAEYEINFIEDKANPNAYAAVEVIPKRGFPRGQAKGYGSVAVGVNTQVSASQPNQSVTPPPLPQSNKYFVAINNQQQGPYTIDELKLIAQRGTITKDNLVWREGMAQWATAGSVQELSVLFSTANPPPIPVTPQRSAGQAGNSNTSPAVSTNPPPSPVTVQRAAGQTGNTNTSPTTSVRSNGTYNIGDRGPAGGIIFYDKGSFSDGWRYLEAAPVQTEFNAEWGGHRQNTNTLAGVGYGKQNTQLIVELLDNLERPESGRAAQLCASLNFGGVTDWFLPSIDELELMYKNLRQAGLGDFARGRYWSSSQNKERDAYVLDFGDGRQRTHEKFDKYRVRAVRAF